MQQSKAHPALALLLAVGVASVAGCERGASLAPVEGKVTLDDLPLVDATVLFSPTRGNGPGPFVGRTNSDGLFVLGTVEKPGSGATAGDYMIMITTVKQDPRSIDGAPVDPTQKEVVPAAYRDGSHRFTVPVGGTKEASFAMKSR